MSPSFWKPSVAASPVRDSAELRAAGSVLRRTKFREGYDLADVDAALERAGAALDQLHRGETPSLTAEAVLKQKFRATKFRDGYDQDEVDDLLDRVVKALRA